MIILKQNENGIIKAKETDKNVSYIVGQTIWSSVYSEEEKRRIRIPMYKVEKVLRGNNLILSEIK